VQLALASTADWLQTLGSSAQRWRGWHAGVRLLTVHDDAVSLSDATKRTDMETKSRRRPAPHWPSVQVSVKLFWNGSLPRDSSLSRPRFGLPSRSLATPSCSYDPLMGMLPTSTWFRDPRHARRHTWCSELPRQRRSIRFHFGPYFTQLVFQPEVRAPSGSDHWPETCDAPFLPTTF
jgi:hypothetical protein